MSYRADDEFESRYGQRGRPLLRPYEEIALALRIRAGDGGARDELIERNLRLAWSIAKHYQGRGFPLEDLVQIGVQGLIIAADRWNPARGCRFSTYACWWIGQAITRDAGSLGRTIHVPLYLFPLLARWSKIAHENPRATAADVARLLAIDESKAARVLDAARSCRALDEIVDEHGSPWQPADPRANDAGDQADRLALLDLAAQRLSVLDARSREVLERRCRGETLRAIADRFDISRERVRQIEKKARTRLRFAESA